MTDLRTLRLRRYMTQRELADAVGVPYQTVQRWESGQSRPRPGNVRKLAEALGAAAHEVEAVLKRNGRAEDQGVKPFDWEEWQRKARGVWPDEDDVDEFIASYREWRREGTKRGS